MSDTPTAEAIAPIPAPDPASATSQQLSDYLNNLRQRVANDKDSVSDDELRHGIKCMRQMRASAASRSSSKKANPAKVTKPLSLDDF